MTELLRLSVRVNNDLSPDQLVDVASVAEEAGFDQFWCSNDLFLRSVMAMLPIVADRTTRISLGTGIVNPYTLHTSEIAMFHRTLAEMSGGRALLGLAAGARDFLSWVGLDRRRPLIRMRESIAELRYLLEGTGNPPQGWADGNSVTGDHAIPIYVGAMGPRMLALSGEVADGVLPLLFPPERFVEARRAVLDGAKAAGRDAADVDVAACVWVSISSDPEQARAVLAEKIAYYGPSFSDNVLEGVGLTRDDLEPARKAHREGNREDAVRLLPASALSLGMYGTGNDIVERCSRLLDDGAYHISFGPPLGPDPAAATHLIGNEVIPTLRHIARSG